MALGLILMKIKSPESADILTVLIYTWVIDPGYNGFSGPFTHMSISASCLARGDEAN